MNEWGGLTRGGSGGGAALPPGPTEAMTHDEVDERLAGGPGVGRGERLVRLDREITRCQAEALGRVGEELDRLLDRLRAADRWLDRLGEKAAASPDAARDLGRTIDARNRLRDEILRVRHHLIIQREALGFVRHGPVEQCYPVPARRIRSGPARETGRPEAPERRAP